eukprot:TRINITY_DN2320_c4_g1_i1.p1 TRINITY_DN2320_c4_g1~~TRINITY_DN2320_c4_g1_i1.p1  ORF type:complete len:4269 (+),score=762.65 TRINITY_DN2320_c4_g1_i1:44-12850(+)
MRVVTNTINQLLVLISLWVGLASCQTITEILSNEQNAAISYDYLIRAGMGNTLRDTTQAFTVFIPSEAAWTAYGRGGQAVIDGNLTELAEVLKYHIVQGVSLNSAQAAASSPLTASTGDLVTVQPDGVGYIVNGFSAIVSPDIAATNGHIHIINRVLDRPSSLSTSLTIMGVISVRQDLTQARSLLINTAFGTQLDSLLNFYTIFVPTDAAFSLLTIQQLNSMRSDPLTVDRIFKHLTSPQYIAVNVTDLITVSTLDPPNDLTYDSRRVFSSSSLLNGTVVISGYIFASNGIIYLTDTVLLPPNVLLPLDIIELVQSYANLSTTASYLSSTGYATTLKGPGPWTLFAPTNDAWDKLESGIKGYIQREAFVLQSVISLHIIQNGAFNSNQLPGLGSVTSLQGGRLLVTLQGLSLVVNSRATVTLPDRLASNGIVHLIESVLITPQPNDLPTTTIVGTVGNNPLFLSTAYQAILNSFSSTLNSAPGPITFLAPSNEAFNSLTQNQLTTLLQDTQTLSRVLAYHCIPRYLSVNDLLTTPLETEYPTLDGVNILQKTISGNFIYMNSVASVNRSFSDLVATNGIVHTVDRLLLPPGVLLPGDTVVDRIGGLDSLKILSSLLAISGVDQNLRRMGPFTVFAPSDTALSSPEIGTGIVPYFQRKPAQLQQFLLHHTTEQGGFDIVESIARSPLQTQQLQELLSVSRLGTSIVVGGVGQVVLPDLAASNGMVHVIDSILPPASPSFWMPQNTIIEILSSYNNVSTYLNSFNTVGGGIDSIIDNIGPITVFVPHNSAFDNLDLATKSSILSSPSLLTKVLRYSVLANQAYMDAADFSLSAPGSVATTDTPNTIAYTNNPVSSGGGTGLIFNQESRILETVYATNGIVHLMSHVLIPNGLVVAPPPTGDTLLAVLQNRPECSIFTSMLPAEVRNILASTSSVGMTLFAPSNEAMGRVGSGTLHVLERDVALKTLLTKHHIVTVGSIAAGSLISQSPLQTAVTGKMLVFELNVVQVIINQISKITVPDVPASNGVLHIIDELLIYPELGLPNLNLLQLIQNDFSLTTMESVVALSQVSPQLQAIGPYTVFAPTDNAWSMFSQLSLIQTDVSVLRQLVEYHVHPQYKSHADLLATAPNSLATQEGSTLITYSASQGGGIGEVVLNNIARITIRDVLATNGVLHVIDAVLTLPLPPVSLNSLQAVLENRFDTTDFAAATTSTGLYGDLSNMGGSGVPGPFTVFAPSNDAWASLPVGIRQLLASRNDILTQIMRNHVVSATALTASSLIAASPIRTLQGGTISVQQGQFGLIVGGAGILSQDLQAVNGIAHVINQVLIPPEIASGTGNLGLPNSNLGAVISNTPGLSSFASALRFTGILNELSVNAETYTVLAPTDAAWTAVNQNIYNDVQQLSALLRRHIIRSYYSSNNLISSQVGVLQTLDINTVSYRAESFQVSGSTDLIFDYETQLPARGVQYDIVATNGVVHIIDSILGVGGSTGGVVPTPIPGFPPTPPLQQQTVLVWGDSQSGGDATTVAQLLSTANGIRYIGSTNNAFAAIPQTGTGVIAWGNSLSGGSIPTGTRQQLFSSQVGSLSATRSAFAALTSVGSVIAWGDLATGGDTSTVSQLLTCCVSKIVSNTRSFTALKTDGTTVSWGTPQYGGLGPQVTQVRDVYNNDVAFAAISGTQNTVVTWGISGQGGGDMSTVSALISSGVDRIFGNSRAMSALKFDGTVVSWGTSADGGDATTVTSVLTGVRNITTTKSAFAAIKSDGTVVTWGQATHGGNSATVSTVLTNVASVFSTADAFAALRQDGSVVTWGNHGGESNTVRSALSCCVTSIYSTDSAFAAVKNDGSVVTWGAPGYGGEVPAQTKNLLQNGVISVSSTESAFAATKTDGTVVAWGEVLSGGNPGQATSLLLTPTIDQSVRSVSGSSRAFASYIAGSPFVPVPVPPSGALCNPVSYCNGNALTASLVNNVCTCYCKANYAGVTCGLCANGFVSYPYCTTSVVTPQPWFPPAYTQPPITPLPDQLPLPVPSPQCMSWAACNGHASSVADTVNGCVCTCYPNFAGRKCDTCSPGYVNYPVCSRGIWVLVSETHSCRMNAEGILSVSGGTIDLLPSLLACQQSCSERNWCIAVDWHRTTQTCRMYSESCIDPKDPFDGASHWRVVQPSTIASPVPTPSPSNVQVGCPWVSPTGRQNELDCADGTVCDIVADGQFCCGNRGGRIRCPMNAPIMCSAIELECGSDYCCVETPSDCHESGGPRPCAAMQVTPCGESSTGGDGQITSIVNHISFPIPGGDSALNDVIAVFSNEASFSAILSNGSVISWGSELLGGSSADVADQLRAGGFEKVFSTLHAFAALSSSGKVVTWGDIGTITPQAETLIERDVVTISTTDAAFAALKRNGGVVTWGHSYYGGDSLTVAAKIASGVKKVFSTRQSFAALKNDGSVVSWGALNSGGGSTNNVDALLQQVPGVKEIFATESAFAAVRNDGSVVTWGYESRGGNSTTVAAFLTQDVVSIASTSMAFAALKNNKTVIVWGDASSGGDPTLVNSLLTNSIERIYSTQTAFTAIRSDNSLVAWGSPQGGGEFPLNFNQQQAKHVFATDKSFAVLRMDGSLSAWGEVTFSQNNPTPLSNIAAVYTNRNEFVAVNMDGTVTVFGTRAGTTDYIHCETKLQQKYQNYRYGLGIKGVIGTADSFAILTHSEETPVPAATPAPPITPSPGGLTDYYNEVVVWGDPLSGGSVPQNIKTQLTCGSVFSTDRAFAAIRADGSVVTWGDAGYGGDSTSVSVRLSDQSHTAIFSNERAFAALTTSGSVTVWGDEGYGGSASPSITAQLSSNVISIYSTQLAFAAVKKDGSVVAWGNQLYGGYTDTIQSLISSNVIGVYSTDQAFAALKSTGEVITWGSGYSGGDSSTLSLRGGVESVYSTYSAFAALKTGGAVLTWGYPGRGGDSSTVATQLLSGVQSLASTDMAFAALKKQQGTATSGTVIAWGDAGYGGDMSTVSSLLTSGVRSIYSTRRAFAAVKTDGTVVVWGNTTHGGYAGPVANQLLDVREIKATDAAFAALLGNGRVVTWGDSGYGGQWSAAGGSLSGVRVLYSTARAFTALRDDGTITSWGRSEFGGDGQNGQTGVPGHRAVYSTESAFAALAPCPIGSKVRQVGAGTCLDSNGGRYGELKAQAFSRSECLQVLLRYSPPARGATYWAARNGCYIAVDEGTSIQGGVWVDRYSYDTSPLDPNNPRVGRGPIGSSDGQVDMECYAADDISFIPTPPPGTPEPAPEITPAPPREVWSWVLVSDTASCEINSEGIQPAEHVFPVDSLTECRRSCESRGDNCVAIDYYENGWCNFYFGTACTQPLDTRTNTQSWKRYKSTGPGTSVVAWGDPTQGGSASTVQGLLTSSVRGVYSNDAAFAALKSDGTVVTWGQGFAGGDSSTVASDLRDVTFGEIASITPSSQAFAALSANGRVTTWGNSISGGASQTVSSLISFGVRDVYATDNAFSAVVVDMSNSQSVVSWGEAISGGDSTTVDGRLRGTIDYVVPNSAAFAALVTDPISGLRRVVSWGDQFSGGDTQTVNTQLSIPTNEVQQVYSNSQAFAARRDDGSVIAWGSLSGGGDATTVASLLQSGVHSIVATDNAFTAIKTDGTVVSWGSVSQGGSSPPGLTNVLSVARTSGAFAATLTDRSVVTWGDPLLGGDRMTSLGGVSVVVGGERAFAAILNGGGIDAWGDPQAGGSLPLQYRTISVQSIHTTDGAFAATTPQGGVVTWGDINKGGDSAAVSTQLSSGVVGLVSTSTAFAALVPTLETLAPLPPGTGLDQCDPSLWVIHSNRCVAGTNRAGDICASQEVLGGQVFQFFCALSQTGSEFVCARCPDVVITTPIPTTFAEGPVLTTKAGACRDPNGAYYREFKKLIFSKDDCIGLLRATTPPAIAAMFWPGNGCYIIVNSNVTNIPGQVWDDPASTDSNPTAARIGSGDVRTFVGVAEPGLETAECLTYNVQRGTTPSPSGITGTGDGLCGRLALPFKVCVDTANAYYCNGMCCCNEFAGFGCDPSDGLCKHGYSGPPNTPLPTPLVTPTPTDSSGNPITVSPGGSGTLSPGGSAVFTSNPQVAAASPDDDPATETWFIILIIVLVILCICCAVLAFACGRRGARDKTAKEKEENKENPTLVDLRGKDIEDDFDEREPIVGFEAPEPREMEDRYSPPSGPTGSPPINDDEDDEIFIGGFSGLGRGTNIPPPPTHNTQATGLPISEVAGSSPGSLRGLPRHFPSAGPRRSHSPNSIVV